MKKHFRILVINPGSTSTKVALFENERGVFNESVVHSRSELAAFKRFSEQENYRVGIVRRILDGAEVDIGSLSAVVGRGGLLKPIPGGTYLVNAHMIADLKEAARGEHASNLGGIMANDFALTAGVPAFIVDPVVVDEMEPVARLSGLPGLERRSIFHALNQKAVARKAAADLGKRYTDLHFIVVHMGGGISVGAHQKGKVVDVNNALNGEGPFAPERAGTLPAGQLVDLCFSGKVSHQEMKKHLVGEGGMVAHLGTHDLLAVKQRIKQGDPRARLVYEAMAYQVAKAIGGCAAVLSGRVDGILLTGGLARDRGFVSRIRRHVGWIGPIRVYPGEEEMGALALGALRVLRGEEEVKTSEADFPQHDRQE